ncbi:MAG: hypothetical protein EBT06_08135 [Gammaproteobacteria bacterium]|nr:hypothetical protein [Gammaproteobacteria bacterium]NBT44876.1 hypothetical protein [Gammaproteobacteria bacterium]NBY22574.1 hypothetical protein [Gammaproteobacteria bacterium]NDE34753.1 hypothetical protein [Gammaproteobacteria bacterium]NDG87941.1 hypothetical protein [Gammaproteobacteria bacterium]
MPMIPEAKGHCLAGRSRASSVSSAPYLRWPFQEFLDPLTGSTTSPPSDNHLQVLNLGSVRKMAISFMM